MGNDAKDRVLSFKFVLSEMPVQPVRVQFSSTAKFRAGSVLKIQKK
jgi:hypothetical protein